MAAKYLIIGSGLIGRLTAWRLLKQGNDVSLLSMDGKKGEDSAGYIAASMVSPATEAVTSEPIVKTIGLRSYQLWPEWLAELPEPVFYADNGTLVVAHQGDQTEMARFQRRAEHVLQASDFQYVEQTQLAKMEPQLAENFEHALWFEQESCIDNRALYRVLTELLDKHCQWQQCEALAELTEDSLEQLCQHYFSTHLHDFDAVLDCRGNGAKANLSELRSVRGEVIRVHAPEVDFKHCVRLMHPRYPFYLAPRPNHEYFLGATVIESDDRSPVSLRSGLELMSALYSLHPGFAEARILEMASHCRPALPNHLPTIRQTDWGYQVNGFYRHGYLFSPAIIEDLLKVLDGQSSELSFGELYDISSVAVY